MNIDFGAGWYDHLRDESLEKIEEGNYIVGTCLFPNKVAALHVAGLFVKTDLLKKVGVKPQFDKSMDVGDVLTVHCRENGLKTFCFKNTMNDKKLIDVCGERWKYLNGVDRAFNSDLTEVIYLHLGRGMMKQFRKYHKPGKVYYKDWCSLCQSVVGS